MLSRRFTHITFSMVRSLLLVLSVSWTTASAQEAHNYGIVSPNTKTDLKLADAIAGMNSAEESKLLNEAINLSCVVRVGRTTLRALPACGAGGASRRQL